MPRGRAGLSAAALAAGLLALTLPPIGLWPLGWVCLVPLFAAANAAARARDAARIGFAAGLAFHGVAAHWIYHTCRFAGVPVPVAASAWAALSAVLALNWAHAPDYGIWAAEVEQAKKNKFSIDSSNYIDGVTLVAVPVFNLKGRMTHSLTAAAVSSQMSSSFVQELVEMLLEGARELNGISPG